MSGYDITEFLRAAYRPFAYCVPSKSPLNTAYQKGGVTLTYQSKLWITEMENKKYFLFLDSVNLFWLWGIRFYMNTYVALFVVYKQLFAF